MGYYEYGAPLGGPLIDLINHILKEDWMGGVI